MTTTELIELLKKYERGGATGRSREVMFEIDGRIINTYGIEVTGSGDGLIPELYLSLPSAQPEIIRCKDCNIINKTIFLKLDFAMDGKEIMTTFAVERKGEQMRLIDADALAVDIKECIEAKYHNSEYEQVQGLETALECIDEAPNIEPERKTGEWSGLWSEPQDDNSIYGEKLMEGDTIYLLGVEGVVKQECGAWGWESGEYVPWEKLEKKMPHGNSPDFCYCDNFVSFWELKWAFDDGYDWDGVPFIRHGAKMED